MMPLQNKIYFNAWDTSCRSPYGAVTKNTRVSFRVSCEAMIAQDIRSVTFMYTINDRSGQEIMIKKENDFLLELTLQEIGAYFYRFYIQSVQGDYYLEPDVIHFGGMGVLYPSSSGKAFQITVYEAIESVAPFYSEGLIYQIFVDRFRNGSPDGLPLAIKENSYLYANWDDVPFYIKNEKQEIVKWEFFGGNLLGITEKLDYLQALGVTCIYLNPIFLARSSHKYDTADYLSIDPMFGNEDHFRELIEEAKKREMYIILDGVFSHTGADSIYFNKFGNYSNVGAYQSKESIYYPWYRFQQYPSTYESWWGVGDLPNVEELEPSYLEFITGPNGVIAKWMKLGIKGFRLDVADELPELFIQKIRQRMKAIDPEAVLLGEVWEDASNKVTYGQRRKYLLGDSLDSVTSYPFRVAVIDLLTKKITARQFMYQMLQLQENYPAPYYQSSLKMLGSHDTARFQSVIGDNQLAKLGWTLLFMYQGSVLLYYGDEMGLEGGEDPYNRATFPWNSYQHLGRQIEKANPRVNQSIQHHIKQLLSIRKEESVLRGGQLIFIDFHPDIVSFIRTDGKRIFLIIINPTQEVIPFIFNIEEWQEMLPTNKLAGFTDLLTQKDHPIKIERLHLELRPKSSYILKGQINS